MNASTETNEQDAMLRPKCRCRSVSILGSGRARPHRPKGASMKQLLRCCGLHDEKYIFHALGLFFARRGRQYKLCPEIAAVQFPKAIPEEKPTGIPLWIAQATQYLCADAKKRIRKEITSHCEDAQAALKESGLSLEEAEMRVLEELGDPLQANKAFQKTYLTSSQERYMARVSEFDKHSIKYSAGPSCSFAALLPLSRCWPS